MSEGFENFIKYIDLNYDTLLTSEDLEQLFGFSKMYLFNLRQRKDDGLPYIRLGKTIKYFKEDVINWVRLCKSRSYETHNFRKAGRAKKGDSGQEKGPEEKIEI